VIPEDPTSIHPLDHPLNHSVQSGDLLAWDYDELSGLYRYVNMFIQSMTMSSYSHVGIAIRRGSDVFVLEATQPKIRISPLKNKGDFYVLPLGPVDHDELERIAQDYIGKEYSILDCIRAYLGLKINSNKRWQCAELAVRVYQRLGIELKPARLTPQSLIKTALIYSKAGLWYF
jgi:hypothetical protein